MQVNIPYKSLTAGGGLSSGGGTLTTPLVLSGSAPSALNEIVSKGYVDAKISSISADTLTTGVLPAARFPAFTGDVSSVAGSGVINLNTTGVAAGTYTKITVNAKGRVIGAGNITATDVPNLNWSKITSGKPTTLSGYGITDAVSKGGGTVTGYITSSVTPTQTLHAVTKQYVDTLSSSSITSYSTGDIIETGVTVTPSGFLRCNGGQLLINSYTALYSVIGTTFGTATSGYFVLPDYTIKQAEGLYYYIKT